MSWAARRRFIIALIAGAVVVAFLTVILTATLYKTPSCTDGVQNQGETGVDCGGPCSALCTVEQEPPTVLFTQVLPSSTGRTSIIASVENKNAGAAAKNVPYKVQLYGSDRSLIQDISGALDLPPGATVPVFIPGITTGKQAVARAFLTMASSSPQWFVMNADPRILPLVSAIKQSGTADAPRIEATLTNPSITELTDVQTIVLVRNEQGSVIAASATIVPVIPAQGEATATFTWNSAFADVPASIQVVPVIPLP
ncbi:hypothetical protein KGQ72_03015 [Patescibacteria group bacterium]|nr:hypothetical protein [Patescibacteria group bacterium]